MASPRGLSPRGSRCTLPSTTANGGLLPQPRTDTGHHLRRHVADPSKSPPADVANNGNCAATQGTPTPSLLRPPTWLHPLHLGGRHPRFVPPDPHPRHPTGQPLRPRRAHGQPDRPPPQDRVDRHRPAPPRSSSPWPGRSATATPPNWPTWPTTASGGSTRRPTMGHSKAWPAT
jgi:hypothetical protein